MCVPLLGVVSQTLMGGVDTRTCCAVVLLPWHENAWEFSIHMEGVDDGLLEILFAVRCVQYVSPPLAVLRVGG